MAAKIPQIDGTFDSGAITINAATDVLVLELTIPPTVGSHRFQGFLALFGFVGAGGALAQLKVTAVDPVAAGGEVGLKADADFDTPDDLVPWATATAYQTAAGGSFLILFRNLAPLTRVRVYAGKAAADTTLRVTGTAR